jgi:hypothetical protein
MRAWWAHNNQKRKGTKKVMEGVFSGEVSLLSAYTPTHERLLRRGHSITGRQEQKEHTTTNSLMSFFFIFISQRIKPFQFIMLPTLCTDASPSLSLSNASPSDEEQGARATSVHATRRN